MKKVVVSILSGLLVLGIAACENSVTKTSTNAPGSTAEVGKSPDNKTLKNNQNDAQSSVRRNQLNSDIRSREQRNDITGGDTNRADSDLSSEVRSKLEANLPSSQLTVSSKKGAIVVSGTVLNQNQLSKIEPLTKQIKGVRSVNVAAKVKSAT